MISYLSTSMISPMISPMIKSIPTLTQFCKQMISMWAYPIAQASGAWQRRGVELGSGEERKAADWSLEVLGGVCPTPGLRMATSPWSRWRRLIAVAPLLRDKLSTTLVVRLHRRRVFSRRRAGVNITKSTISYGYDILSYWFQRALSYVRSCLKS